MARHTESSDGFYRTNVQENPTRSMVTRESTRTTGQRDVQRPVATVLRPCLQKIVATREAEIRELGQQIVHAMSKRAAGDPQDWMPIIAQLKSLFQVMFGDVDGARQTQEEFLRAWQMSKLEILSAILDGTPLVGHIKGG
jgi:hypothetical protein